MDKKNFVFNFGAESDPEGSERDESDLEDYFPSHTMLHLYRTNVVPTIGCNWRKERIYHCAYIPIVAHQNISFPNQRLQH